MKKYKLTKILVILGLAISVQAQQKTLTKDEFYTPIRQAEQLRYKTSRREKKTLEIYEKGKVKSIKTELEEVLSPDTQRYLLINEEGNKISKLELIQIGKNFYQKKDNGNWTKESSWGKGGSFLAIPLPEIEEYKVENVKVGNLSLKLYKYYAVYNEKNPGAGEEIQTFWEQKYWIDPKGLNVKEEITVGKPISKEIWSHRIYNIEYNPKNLKIEAPVK